jgi:TonB-linked SusC/RagA family outer membrane protein
LPCKHTGKPNRPQRYPVLLLIVLLLLSPALSAQPAAGITLSVKNETLQTVFDQLERTTACRFTYKDVVLPTEKNISITATNSPVEAFLDRLLAPAGLSYLRTGNTFAIVRRAPGKDPVVVEGRATDKSGDPVTGASVTLKNNPGKGTVTGVDGTFSLPVEAGQTLVVSCLGYETQEIPAGNRKRLNIQLKESNRPIDEVVVVGYRTVKKLSLTGSVSAIEMKQKENQPITNTGQALYNTPGVWIGQGESKPGRDGVSIRVRGVNSLNNVAPLVLVDGIEYDINEIDPASIHSITILKDVSAAIYGSKAANGVVLITSKSGAKGKARVEYKGSAGVQRATCVPDVVSDPVFYMRLYNQAQINGGIDPSAVNYRPADIAEYEAGLGTDPTLYPASDWFDIMLRDGLIQKHSLRLSGGTDAVTYSTGIGYTGQTGIWLANDAAQRYSWDFKLTAHASEKLNVTASMLGNFRPFEEPEWGIGSALDATMRALPMYTEWHKNNIYGASWLSTPGINTSANPYMFAGEGNTLREYSEFLASLAVDCAIAKNLKYYATLGWRKTDHFSKDWRPLMYIMQNTKTEYLLKYSTNLPFLKDWYSGNWQLSLSHRLVYENTFAGRHNLHAMIGHDVQDNKSRNFQAENKIKFTDNTLQELSVLKDYSNAVTTGGSWFERLISVYGRLAYTFDEKYLLEATLRNDASSRLAPGHRWALFPSVMLGWRIDRESFFEEPQVDLLKLRASVGEMGSQSVDRYSYMMTVAAQANYTFGGTQVATAAVSNLVDPELTWEKTRSYNVGADLGAFNNKLYLEADLFYKRTFDILRRKTAPAQVGLGGPTSNVGIVDNKGYEISLAWRDKIKNVSYGLNASLAYVHNEVVDLKGEQIISSDRRITLEGYPINSFYMYEADGYYASYDEIAAAKAVYGSRAALRPGYIKYVDQNNDNVIDEKDRIVVGSIIPKYNYSFGISLGYKNFALESTFQGVSEVNVYPTGNLAFPFYNGAPLTWEQTGKSWKSPEDVNARYPLLTLYSSGSNNFIPSTQWLRNAAYLRMKNIQLSYTVPQALTQHWKMNTVTIYISGQNLLTFTEYTDGDPEMTGTRDNLFEYPNLKTLSMGINVTF